MSEFPKSFHWKYDETDVITFRSEDDMPRCKSNDVWTYKFVTSDRLQRWVPCGGPADHAAELQTLRTFHATVMQATQDTPNHRLCEAIFAADKVVRLELKDNAETIARTGDDY